MQQTLQRVLFCSTPYPAYSLSYPATLSKHGFEGLAEICLVLDAQIYLFIGHKLVIMTPEFSYDTSLLAYPKCESPNAVSMHLNKTFVFLCLACQGCG